jgi:hypothetical protein
LPDFRDVAPDKTLRSWYVCREHDPIDSICFSGVEASIFLAKDALAEHKNRVQLAAKPMTSRYTGEQICTWSVFTTAGLCPKLDDN